MSKNRLYDSSVNDNNDETLILIKQRKLSNKKPIGRTQTVSFLVLVSVGGQQ